MWNAMSTGVGSCRAAHIYITTLVQDTSCTLVECYLMSKYMYTARKTDKFTLERIPAPISCDKELVAESTASGARLPRFNGPNVTSRNVCHFVPVRGLPFATLQ